MKALGSAIALACLGLGCSSASNGTTSGSSSGSGTASGSGSGSSGAASSSGTTGTCAASGSNFVHGALGFPVCDAAVVDLPDGGVQGPSSLTIVMAAGNVPVDLGMMGGWSFLQLRIVQPDGGSVGPGTYQFEPGTTQNTLSLTYDGDGGPEAGVWKAVNGSVEIETADYSGSEGSGKATGLFQGSMFLDGGGGPGQSVTGGFDMAW